MWEWLTSILALPGIEEISYVKWQLQNQWPAFVKALLLVGVIAFAVASYRFENARRRGKLLTTLRVIGCVLLLVILLQPVLAIEYTTKGDSVVLTVLDRSESMSVSDERRDRAARDAVIELVGRDAAAEGGLSRWDVARAAISDEQRGILQQLAGEHAVDAFTVAEEAAVMDREKTLAPDAEAAGSASALGSALDDLSRRYGGENVAGIVLVSDMAWNVGKDPVSLAKRLGERGRPVFPVVVGEARPPDTAVTRIIARDRVFPGQEIPVKVQIRASEALAGRSAELVIRLGDREAARKSVTLEAGMQVVELPVSGKERSGSVPLVAELAAQKEEVTERNNRKKRTLTFIEEKIKVLYVEGFPRWEYRYLSWVLRRDPRLDVQFLMTEGDPELAEHSPIHLGAFPAEGHESFDFDLVILGDVPAGYFRSDQMSWMEQQVKRRGGSLLMVGGSLHAPQSYKGTPIGKLLPVRVEGDEWHSVSDRVAPVPTEAGFSGKIGSLGVSPKRARGVWSKLRPLYDVAPVAPKPGSRVLVTLSEKRGDGDRPYPLVSWHRYGSGKAFFVGTELLWRLREKVGRKHHEHFWSSTIQFLTLSRLLGGNKRVTLETDRPQYQTGESVRLFADVLDRFLDPVTDSTYRVEVRKAGAAGEEAGQQVPLSASPGAEGFYRGFFVPREPGTYKVLAREGDRSAANVARFEVVDASPEMVDPGARPDVAQKLAERSGGRVVPLAELGKLSEWIERRQPRFIRELSFSVWDHWLVYVLLLLVAGLEWWLRRRERLV